MKKEHVVYPHQIFDSIYIMYWMLIYERKEINNEDFKWIIGKDNFESLKNNVLCLIFKQKKWTSEKSTSYEDKKKWMTLTTSPTTLN
jgi:nicotinic acid mononucleotide adenylyltransferase